jgi:hypothetical protein
VGAQNHTKSQHYQFVQYIASHFDQCHSPFYPVTVTFSGALAASIDAKSLCPPSTVTTRVLHVWYPKLSSLSKLAHHHVPNDLVSRAKELSPFS